MYYDQLVQFFDSNPEPTDQQFHAFALSINVDKETLEAEAYKMLSCFMRRFDGFRQLDADNFDASSLSDGIAAESEYVDCPEIAESLAKAMLTADPQYYAKNGFDGESEEQELESPTLSRAIAGTTTINSARRRAHKKGRRTLATDLMGTTNDLDVVGERQKFVSAMMDRICSQLYLDHTAQILRDDKFFQEASNLSDAYAGLRTAMLTNGEQVLADPKARKVRTYIVKANNRDGGESIRVSYARAATNLLRELTTQYGSGARNQFFLSSK